MHGCGLNGVVPACVDRRRTGKHQVDDFDVLLEATRPLRVVPVRDTDHTVAGVHDEPQSETSFDTAAGDVIDSDYLARERSRISHRYLSNARREPDTIGRLRDRGESGPHIKPRHRGVLPIDELIRRRRDIEAEFLGMEEAAQEFSPGEVGEHLDLEPSFESHQMKVSAFSITRRV